MIIRRGLEFLLVPLAFSTIFSAELFCPPAWPIKIIQPSDVDIPALEPLGVYDGCICRRLPQKFTVCYGDDSCTKLPKSVSVDTLLFRVKTTRISEILLGDLMSLTHITNLEIEGNSELVRIEPGSFKNMTQLKKLSISYNTNLKVLENETFEGLENLLELKLIQNGFTKITQVTKALQPRILPKLLKLSLSENEFVSIYEGAFEPMTGSSLEELNLVLCQIEYIHSDVFLPLKHLEALRLGENNFENFTITKVIERCVSNGIPLKLLNLYGNGMRKSPPKGLLRVVAKSNITHLCLAKNHFEIIQDTTFPYTPRLEYLDLREVLILNVTSNAFSGMPNLKTLLLSNNKLSYIPEGVLLESLTYLDLSANSGDSYFPSYFSLGKKRFSKMKKLKLLNLSYNRINSIMNQSFIGLDNLETLGLKNATVFHIKPYAFHTLKKLKVLNLENNPFSTTVSLSAVLFYGLDSLEVLMLGGCMITHLFDNGSVFEYLPNLKHLGIERNQLVTLNALVFQPLTKLTTLDLTDNFLVSWQKRLFFSNSSLKVVLAAYNRIAYMTGSMLDDFSNLTRVDLKGNPFNCDCYSLQPLSKWMENHKNLSVLKNTELYPNCVYSSGAITMDGVDFLNVIRDKMTKCDVTFQYNSLIILGIFGIILIMMTIITYLYRWQIKYFLFVICHRLGKHKQLLPRSKNTDETFAYDAFISYSNEDREFVMKLVSMLENKEPFYRLCVYERDFQVGAVISSEVLENVAKSRKTLLVISDSYVRSHWCRWEVQIAEHYKLMERDGSDVCSDDSIILVKLGEITSSKISPTLKYLMRTKIYLQWDPDLKREKIFWDKLRNILAQK